MMLPDEVQGCKYKDQLQSHGSEICIAGKCMICNNGKWEDRVEMFPPTKSGIPTEHE